MDTKKLFKLLKLVQNVRVHNWDVVHSLVDELKNNKIVIWDKKWHDKFKQEHQNYYPLDLLKIETWSTYDGSCIDLEFSNTAKENILFLNHTEYPSLNDDDFICKARIYDGSNLDGHRNELRFEAIFKLNNKFIHKIEAYIQSEFNYYLEDAYENHLETKKQLWINNLRNEIIEEPLI